MATTVVLDVETIGLDGIPAAAIADMAEKRHADVESFAALCPPLARVVCAGFLAVEPDREHAVYDSWLLPAKPETPGEPLLGEQELLRRVNEVLSKATRLVTFNGRGYDLPVIVHRTLAQGLKPAPLLLRAAREYRYRPDAHVDVLDQVTFYGASPRHSLRAYALGYGLADPKVDGDGAHVAELVAAGDAARLVAYCLQDVRTTAAIYRQWMESVGLAS